jgi:membrane-anchored glycerophosphoryl diester phosphodiesterase (GDPDase)
MSSDSKTPRCNLARRRYTLCPKLLKLKVAEFWRRSFIARYVGATITALFASIPLTYVSIRLIFLLHKNHYHR